MWSLSQAHPSLHANMGKNMEEIINESTDERIIQL